MKIKLPIKVYNEANGSDHWTKRAARRKSQKQAIKLLCSSCIDPSLLPCVIKLTRISPRKLDNAENLPYAFKGIIDAIAELLIPGKAIGRADGDPRMKFEFDQAKGYKYECAMEIEIVRS
jgi:hypothetical protein